MRTTFRTTYLVWSIFMLTSSSNLFAQKVDYVKTYEQAKTEFKNKNFDKAMDLFKLVAHYQENPQHINATYFYAYCALKNKQYWSANHYLNKIIDKYPEWNKINEVYYLQTQIAFEKREYSQAIVMSQKVKSKFIKTDLENMKWNFLFFPSLKDTVTEIQKRFPSDTCVANILYNLVKDDTEWKSKKITKNLIESYRMEQPIKVENKTETLQARTKDTLSIAIVLPFNLTENLQDNTIKNDAYLYDLYTGIRLAADSMLKTGAKIRLVTYDYGKDSAGFCNLIDQPEMAQYDILIGPIQNSLGTKVSQFAEKNKILVINPLSTNSKFTEGSDWVYLFKSSLETQTCEAANFAYNNFLPKKALIITSKSPKDSATAVLFQKSFEKAGGKVLGKTVLTVGNLAQLGSVFNKKTLDSTGFIFVSTKDQYLGVNIVKQLTEKDRTTPLLVFPEWLEFQSINYQQMQKQNIFFIAPEYVNYQSDTVLSVSNFLQNKTNLPPSEYTYVGFELIYQLCSLAKNDPTFFALPNLKGKWSVHGLLQKGMDYSKGKDNRSFGIYRFTDAGFEESTLSADN